MIEAIFAFAAARWGGGREQVALQAEGRCGLARGWWTMPPAAAAADQPPPEFSPDAVASGSPPEQQLYQEFNSNAEPGASLTRQGLAFTKDAGSPTHLNDDDANYYNTTGSAAEFWADRGLPAPAKSIETLRGDLQRWGYCLVEDGLSEQQLSRMLRRVEEQAAGEREAGVGLYLNASATGSNTQFVTTLLNKGAMFEGALEFDAAHVQAAPVLEQLLTEALGGDFLINSFQAIIAQQHGYPQALHQDLNGSAPFQHPEAPLLVTAMFMLNDVGPENGGSRCSSFLCAFFQVSEELVRSVDNSR